MKDEQGWRRRRREEDLVDRYQEDAFNRSHVGGTLPNYNNRETQMNLFIHDLPTSFTAFSPPH